MVAWELASLFIPVGTKSVRISAEFRLLVRYYLW